MTRTTITAGGYQGEASVHTRALRVLADALARRSHGAADLALEPNVTAAGRNATDLLADVEAGRTDMCYFASSYLVDRVAPLTVFELPFATAGRADVFRKVDGEAGAAIAAAVGAATGFEVAGFWDNGLRHVSNRIRPLRTPADCAGLSIRTIHSPLQRAAFATLGFEPATIDVKDLPEAVATGRVDAQENPLTNTVNFDLHLTHRFHSLTGHVHGIALVLLNRERARRWPASVRQALTTALAEATAAQRRFAAEEDARCLAIVTAAGGQVLGPDALDMAPFRAATARLREGEIAKLDPALAAACGLR